MNNQTTSIIDDNKEIEIGASIEITSVIDNEEEISETDNLEEPKRRNISKKIQKCCKHITHNFIKLVNNYINIKYLHEIFSTILGMTGIVLIIVLF
jgi:hypothetical protein